MVDKEADSEEFLSEEAIQKVMSSVGLFAEQLALWDKRIIEIVAIGGLARGELTKQDAIQLVCAFHPEPQDQNQGYFSIANLMVRDEFEKISERLNITHSIDLGFRMQSKIYLPNGNIQDTPDKQITVWPQYHHEEKSIRQF